jgi:hypothetical protein
MNKATNIVMWLIAAVLVVGVAALYVWWADKPDCSKWDYVTSRGICGWNR